MKIVFLDAKSIADNITWPVFNFTNQITRYENTKPSEVAKRISNAHIVISNKVPINASAIQSAKKLKHIAIPATGYNHIDLQACQQKKITVSHVANYAATTVAEHCVTLLFALMRNLVPYVESVKKGRWQAVGQFSYFDYPIQQVQGATLGIIGGGTLGRAFAKKAETLGMRILYAERKQMNQIRPGYTAFEQVLKQSDVISLHCPLTPETKHLLDTDAFQKMARKPFILNTARGDLIDPDALVQALEKKQIQGAGIDVVEQEPPSENHPYMKLLKHSNFILTPHIAWANKKAMQKLVNELVKNINSFVQDKPRNLVY